jgi:hypothetical protein
VPVPTSGSSIVGTEAYVHMTGYSYKSNEHGLSVDTVTEFHLVSPNGTEIVVTEAEKDLWFALKVCLSMATKRRETSSMLAFTTGRIQQLREFQIVTLGMSLKLRWWLISTRES